jgi:hypothetical protein
MIPMIPMKRSRISVLAVLMLTAGLGSTSAHASDWRQSYYDCKSQADSALIRRKDDCAKMNTISAQACVTLAYAIYSGDMTLCAARPVGKPVESTMTSILETLFF